MKVSETYECVKYIGRTKGLHREGGRKRNEINRVHPKKMFYDYDFRGGNDSERKRILRKHIRALKPYEYMEYIDVTWSRFLDEEVRWTLKRVGSVLYKVIDMGKEEIGERGAFISWKLLRKTQYR